MALDIVVIWSPGLWPFVELSSAKQAPVKYTIKIINARKMDQGADAPFFHYSPDLFRTA
jgi:hypothetical protein